MYHGVRWVCIPRSDPPPGQGSVGMGCVEGLPPYRFVSRFPVNHWWGLFYLSMNHYDCVCVCLSASLSYSHDCVCVCVCRVYLQFQQEVMGISDI